MMLEITLHIIYQKFRQSILTEQDFVRIPSFSGRASYRNNIQLSKTVHAIVTAELSTGLPLLRISFLRSSSASFLSPRVCATDWRRILRQQYERLPNFSPLLTMKNVSRYFEDCHRQLAGLLQRHWKLKSTLSRSAVRVWEKWFISCSALLAHGRVSAKNVNKLTDLTVFTQPAEGLMVF